MRISRLLLLSAIALGLSACEGENPEVEALPRGGVQVTQPEQIYRQEGTAVPQRAVAAPEQRAEEFFQALRNGQVQEAAALVSKKTLPMEEQQLIEQLRQWSERAAKQQPFEVYDSRREGSFAIVRAQMTAGGADSVRPVVMFQEDGDWKVVWSLLGMEPDRLAALDPTMARQLEPLYHWYEERQRVALLEQAAPPRS